MKKNLIVSFASLELQKSFSIFFDKENIFFKDKFEDESLISRTREELKFCKKNKISKFLHIESEEEIFLFYKKEKRWKIFSKKTLDPFLTNKFSLKFNVQKNTPIPPYVKIDKNSPVKYNNNSYDKSTFFNNIFVLFESDYIVSDIEEFERKNDYSSFSYKSFDSSYENWEKFKSKIPTWTNVEGIEYDTFNIDSDEIILKTNYSKTNILFNEGCIEIYTFSSMKNYGEAELYNESLQENIYSNINNILFQKSKFSPKHIVLSILGLIVFFVLLSLMLIYILHPSDFKNAFIIMSDPNTWKSIWIYLDIFNFIASYFLIFLAAIIADIIINKGKINFGNAKHWFIAGQVKMVAKFLTGNFFISMFVWGWYLSNTTKTKVVGLAVGVSSANIIRAIVNIFFGGAFMIIGTIFVSGAYEISDSKSISILISFAWIGFVWALIHNLALYSIIFIKPVARTYYRVKSWFVIKYRPESYLWSIDRMESAHMIIKNSPTSFFADKHRIMMISGLVIFAILLESFESIYALNITTSYYSSELPLKYSPFFNFISLGGGRSMIAYSNQFLNLPGQGMLYSEHYLEEVWNLALYNKYGLLSSTSEIVNIISSSTTVITRFFNTYLHSIFAAAITLFIVFQKLILQK